MSTKSRIGKLLKAIGPMTLAILVKPQEISQKIVKCVTPVKVLVLDDGVPTKGALHFESICS